MAVHDMGGGGNALPAHVAQAPEFSEGHIVDADVVDAPFFDQDESNDDSALCEALTPIVATNSTDSTTPNVNSNTSGTNIPVRRDDNIGIKGERRHLASRFTQGVRAVGRTASGSQVDAPTPTEETRPYTETMRPGERIKFLINSLFDHATITANNFTDSLLEDCMLEASAPEVEEFIKAIPERRRQTQVAIDAIAKQRELQAINEILGRKFVTQNFHEATRQVSELMPPSLRGKIHIFKLAPKPGEEHPHNVYLIENDVVQWLEENKSAKNSFRMDSDGNILPANAFLDDGLQQMRIPHSKIDTYLIKGLGGKIFVVQTEPFAVNTAPGKRQMVNDLTRFSVLALAPEGSVALSLNQHKRVDGVMRDRRPEDIWAVLCDANDDISAADVNQMAGDAYRRHSRGLEGKATGELNPYRPPRS